ncbi:BnaAnng41570D, partial [Brassica napus]
ELGHITQINLNDIFASSSAKSPKLHRRYLPSLLDQFPPSDHSLYPPHPPHFPTCVLPAGVAFHSSGFVSSDPIAFRDRVCEDVTEAYRLPPNTYADKCICIVSHAPNFRALWDSLEVIFGLYFSSEGSCPTGETTFAATAELPLLSGNVLSASSKGCGDLADERMVAQITVAKHRKPNHAPFDLTKKKVMNVILDPIEDSTESQAEKTYSLLAFDGLQSSFAGQKSVSLLTSCFF